MTVYYKKIGFVLLSLLLLSGCKTQKEQKVKNYIDHALKEYIQTNDIDYVLKLWDDQPGKKMNITAIEK